MIHIKRAYDGVDEDDGYRILVDRLWPRGLRKEDAKINLWMKDVAPSAELRQWFAHDPARWAEFRRRYRDELAGHAKDIAELKAKASPGTLTLVYAAKDIEHNNALVLKEALEE